MASAPTAPISLRSARRWQSFLPDAVFVAPDAPEPFEAGGSGRQWFSIVGVSDANREERVLKARAGFDRVVAREIERAGFAGRLDRVALFGFSQGAILSLDALADGRWPVAAVVAASGRLVTPVGPNAAVSTPALIIHGERDDVISAAEAGRAKRALQAAGFSVEAHVYPGLGHSVSPQGLDAGGPLSRKPADALSGAILRCAAARGFCSEPRA